MKTRTLSAIVSAMAVLVATFTQAADLYWSGTPPTLGGVGTWNNSSSSTNWGTTVVGPFLAWTNANNDTAVFNGTGGTVTLGTDITVGGLTFNKVNGGTTYYTIDAAANAKTLSFASGNNAINLNIGNGGAPTATIIGQVGGSGANLIIAPQSTVASGGGTGFGTVIFNGASAGGWDGVTTINAAGTLSTVSTSALTNRVLANTSSITLNGGTIQFTRASNANIDAISPSAIGVNGGGTFSVTSSSGGASAIEDIGTVTVNSGQMNFVQTANNQNTITLGGLSRGATAGITFSSPAFGTARWKVSGAGTTSGWIDAAASNSIIGAWATIGTTAALQTDYAVYNGDYVAAANTAASSETTWGDAAKQYTLSYATKTATALTATRNIAALKASTPIATVSTATATGSPTFTVASGHSFAVNDPVVLGTFVGNFVVGQVYYVQSVGGGNTTFTLSATPGGAAINAGSNVTATFAGGLKLDSGITLGTMGILNAGSALAIGRTLAGSGSISLPTAGAGNLFINAGSGNIGIDVPIVNNGGALTLVKTGNSILHLSNNNTFTGGLVVNAGTLRLSGAQSFTGGVTLSGGAIGDSTDGISAAEINNNSVTVNGNASMYITSGETLAGAIAISSTGNLKLNGATATLGGVVSGSGVLTITGTTSPTVTLANTANTHTGVISIVSDNNGNAHLVVNSLADSASAGAGNIQMGGGGTLGSYLFALHSGAIAPLILNNRQVELVGDGPSATYPFKLANNSAQAFTINSNLRASGSNIKTLTLGGTGSGLSTFAGNIGNGGHTTLHLTKADANNTWVLTGANTYNGTTTISAGTLRFASGALGSSGAINASGGTLEWLSGNTQDISSRLATTAAGITTLNTGGNDITFANALGSANSGLLVKTGLGTLTLQAANNYTGTTTVNMGTLALDYTTVGSKLADGAALILGGGTVDLKNGASSHTEVVSATTLTALTGSYITQSSGSSILQMNTITPNTGTVNFGAENIATVDNLNNATTGIIGAWATVGGDWAINSGSTTVGGATVPGTGIADGFIRAYNNYTDVTRLSSGTKAISNGTTTNVRIIDGTGSPADNTVTGTIAINSLNQSATGGASTISMANQTLRTDGILMGPSAGALTIGAAGGTVALSGTLTPTTSSGSIVVNNNSSNPITINSVIAENGASSKLVKAGTGVLILTGVSTYLGGTTLQDGTIRAGASATILGSNNNNGITMANKSTALFDLADFNVSIKNLDGGGSLGGNVTLGSGTLTINNPSGAGYAGIISGTGNLIVNGSSGWTTTGAHTYTGTTTILSGTGFTTSILADGGVASGIGAASSAAGNLVFHGGGSAARLTYNGTTTASTDRLFSLQSSGSIMVSAAGSLNFTNTGSMGFNGGVGAKTLTLDGNSTGNGTLAASIGDNTLATSIIKGRRSTTATANTWSLTSASNTFTGEIILGTTTVSAGTLAYASAGGANAIIFDQTTGAATLSYIGAVDKTMSGPITANALTTGTITLDASGTGAINYSNTGSMGTAASGNRNLILSGSNTGNNTLAACWNNNTGGTATLTKNGVGTWALSGTNTFSGITTVNAGTLVLAASTCLLDTNRLTIATGAKVKLNAGVREIVGYLTTNGTQAVSGTYGSSASAAAIKNDLFFDVAGTGVLFVGVPIPPNGTLIQLF